VAPGTEGVGRGELAPSIRAVLSVSITGSKDGRLDGRSESKGAWFAPQIVEAVPFHRHMCLAARVDSEGIASVSMPDDDRMVDDIGEVHASAVHAIADAAGRLAVRGLVQEDLEEGYVIRPISYAGEVIRPARGAVEGRAVVSDPGGTADRSGGQGGGSRMEVSVAVRDQSGPVANIVIQYALHRTERGEF
jgi:acyl-coenzyme A thioesterase PaaI-like protein